MPNIVITGAQWGDEGKGKIIDRICRHFQVVVRYNGGHNAGHTVNIGDERFILHLLPSGVLHEGMLCVLGDGTVVDLWALEEELRALGERGVEVGENLLLSERAHLVLPYHRVLEELAEQGRGGRRIQTTGRGIGPAYEDKFGRRGVRLGDLRRPERLGDRLEQARVHFEAACRAAGREPDLDWERLVKDLTEAGERLCPRIGDAGGALRRHIAGGYSVLFEGAQATMLDIDQGSYPFVTSSTTVSAGACAGTGVPPTRIDGILGIAKAYTTRVGGGPFPTELEGDAGEELRRLGAEYGATTGRPRRCGWFDALVVRHAAEINGFDALALTKLDVLDALDEIKVCTGYLYEGERLDTLPADAAVLEGCEPQYETLPGWKSTTAGLRAFRDLPQAAQAYVERLGELAGVPVGMISTGADRDDTIVRPSNALSSWLE